MVRRICGVKLSNLDYQYRNEGQARNARYSVSIETLYITVVSLCDDSEWAKSEKSKISRLSVLILEVGK